MVDCGGSMLGYLVIQILSFEIKPHVMYEALDWLYSGLYRETEYINLRLVRACCL